MGTRMFYTVVKANHKLGGKTYVRGRVHGIMEAICSKDPGKEILYGIGENELGMIIPTRTTSRRYKKFAEIVERLYPGLCIFDYKRVN